MGSENSSALNGIAPSAVNETKDFKVDEKQMCPADTRRNKMSEYHCVYIEAVDREKYKINLIGKTLTSGNGQYFELTCPGFLRHVSQTKYNELLL